MADRIEKYSPVRSDWGVFGRAVELRWDESRKNPTDLRSWLGKNRESEEKRQVAWMIYEWPPMWIYDGRDIRSSRSHTYTPNFTG